MNRSRLFCSFPMTCEYGSWEGNTSKKPDVNRSHEPVGIPLNRPPGTFSPTGGEGRDEGVRFMESPLSFFACIGTMNHPPTRPPGTLSPSEGERDGVRGRFMESLLSLLRMDLDHEPAAQPIPLLQDHPLPQWGRGMG